MGRAGLLVVSLMVGVAGIATGVLDNGQAAALGHSRKVCSTVRPAGTARCHAIILTDQSDVTPLTTGAPQGYGPANFKAAYGVHGTAATNVGIVVAYDAPTILNDVAVFSKTYGLPGLPSCSLARQNGCLDKLNQRGTTSYPATNSTWAVEASLDVESVHGQCPSCRITLVEAASPTTANLSAAVDTAVAHGAKIVSNSYGSSESASELSADRHYNQPGVTMIASSGDSGYGTNYPAASGLVVAVGGTSLQMNGTKVVSETAWTGAGSGCSQYEFKPSWQHDKKCLGRTIADVSADADPNTGAAIYDSYPTGGRGGWFTMGGTSLAAPLVAGIIASSGLTSVPPAYLYTSGGSVIRDIVSGSNGSCGATYLCRAGVGYDGPTGLGVLSRL